MKRKIEIVCWILFTICSDVCFFINFMSKPPVDDTRAFTLYMIGAAVISLLYPVSIRYARYLLVQIPYPL